jgi:NAD-dependent SIR2 family protein deacetylase
MMKKLPDALIITAGAGMSTDCGLPDYKGSEKWENKLPIVKKLNLKYTDLADPKWFYTKPEIGWGFYGARLQMYNDAVPHQGYHDLLEFAKKMPFGYGVITSNVDTLFRRAGFSSEKTEQLHGSIIKAQCTYNCNEEIWDIDPSDFQFKNDFATKYPHCPKCKKPARPNILLFRDHGWNPAITIKERFRINEWMADLKDKNVLVLEIGAGMTIPTIRLTSQSLTEKLDADFLRINQETDWADKSTLRQGAAVTQIKKLIAEFE